jgi:hypothetical protein
MSKLEVIGDGTIRVGNTLYNVRNFLTIEKHTFAYNEHENESYGIRLTPPQVERSFEGSNGSFVLLAYTEDEKELREKDFELTILALEEKQQKMMCFTILSEITELNHVIKTSFQFEGESVKVYMNGIRQSLGEDFNFLSDKEIVIRKRFDAGTKFIIEN